MKNFLFLLLLSSYTISSSAQSYTFSDTVGSIIYSNCGSCHRGGSIAPDMYKMTDYQQVFAMRYTIKSYINSHTMPPWPPDPQYSRFSHERILNQQQIDIISQWVDSDAPRGDSTKEPMLPKVSSGSHLSNVGLSQTIPTYKVTSTVDDYRCYAMPATFSSAKVMTGVEFLPGNSKIVHHILLYYDTTGVCVKLDKADPKPGYESFGGIGSSSAVLIGGWVPGSSLMTMPAGMGMTIPKGATLVMQVHYAPGSENQSDSTSFNMQFSSQSGLREVYEAPALNHFTSMINGPIDIPADSIVTYYEKLTIPYSVSIISIAPHMHLLGQNIKVYAVEPKGDTIQLIRINKWDFHWQGFYTPRKVIVLKAFTTVYAEATYDNTANNPNNPNSPPKEVTAGESTTNEMMLVFFGYLQYKKGDENIVLDSSALTTITSIEALPAQVNGNAFKIFPNPSAVNSSATMNFSLQMPSMVQINLLRINGDLISTKQAYYMSGEFNLPLQTAGLARGVYLCSFTSNGTTTTKRILIQ